MTYEEWEQDMYDEITYGDHSWSSEDFRPHKEVKEEGMRYILLDFVEDEDEDEELPF